eukprot:GHRR01002771.1.p1 GENE.GHRR01002771.1~~GHRR01002771.1.p1  ORF type:complete len:174 (+),score=52.80 GHRR01002771.1:65-586(+)
MLATSMRSAFTGQAVSSHRVICSAPRTNIVPVIEAAHKKGAGSTKNGRDSESKRRGVKVYGGQPVKAGGIIFRQTGSTWHAGENVGTGKDYTIFSKVDGIVIYSKRKDRSLIHVYPFEHNKARAAVAVTHTTKPREGQQSRKERRRTMYTPRSQQRAQAEAATVAMVAASVTP